MKRISIMLVSLLFATQLCAQDIKLPEPQKTGGMPLMEALNLRKTDRDFSPKELDNQLLSNLLWAANGINRPDGRRTAPTARNMQQMDIYLYLPSGVYLYMPKENILKLIVAGDYRKESAKQEFAQKAPVILVYVANYDKMDCDEECRTFYGATDCGNVSQNVYLFCASQKLHTVAIGMIDREAITKLLKINGKPILGQPIGFPK
ncbi:MAG: SagB/ThcOx family dehydrogenase [Bacteroidales bacterium]|jgi:SagB-type dehydrogenase family enzyme|nr:SagB/ThcOx family dehydrogenase [Bacteroidales bacterium]